MEYSDNITSEKMIGTTVLKPECGRDQELSKDNATRYSTVSRGIQDRNVAELIEKINLKTGDICLDLGCGTGDGTSIIGNRVGCTGKVIGIDPDSNRIQIATSTHSRDNITFIHSKLTDANLDTCYFDAVLSNHVFHWIPTIVKIKTLQEVYKILKPSCKFIFTTTFDYGEVENTLMPFYPHKREYSEYIFFENEQFYRDAARSIGFHFESIHHSDFKIPFPTDLSGMEWIDASNYTNFRSTWCKHKDDVVLPRTTDGMLLETVPIETIILRKPLNL